MKPKLCKTIRNCFNYERALGTFFLTSVFEIMAKTLNSKKQLNEQMLSNLNNHSLGLPKRDLTLRAQRCTANQIKILAKKNVSYKKEWILQKNLLYLSYQLYQ